MTPSPVLPPPPPVWHDFPIPDVFVGTRITATRDQIIRAYVLRHDVSLTAPLKPKEDA